MKRLILAVFLSVMMIGCSAPPAPPLALKPNPVHVTPAPVYGPFAPIFPVVTQHSSQFVPKEPVRASRSQPRVKRVAPKLTVQVPASQNRIQRHSGKDYGVQDITRYCWTGSRNSAGRWPVLGDVAVLNRSIPFGTRVRIGNLGTYVVRDWIGHGSQWDIYSGKGSSCETHASNFGRLHMHVHVVG